MNLQKEFQTKIVPALQTELGYKNAMAVPKPLKVTLNVGMSRALKEPAFAEVIEANIIQIAGQKPVKTLSKKSISNFKIRQGQVVGMKVTLRGKRMFDFLEKFIKVTLPRIKDFRGLLPKIIDRKGNLNIGIRESIAFPEIKAEEIEKIHSLEVSVTANAKNSTEGEALWRALGFPIIKK